MDDLRIQATKYTPEIIFEAEQNTLSLAGESYPENTMEVYTPVFKWLKQFLSNPDMPKLIVNVDLNYFNSSSSKTLINLFDLMDSEAKSGKKIVVNWIYEEDDEDNLEFGEEFAEDLEKLQFNLVSKPSD